MAELLSVEQVLSLLDGLSISGSPEELPLHVERLGSLNLTADARLLLHIISAQAKAHFGESAEAVAHLDELEAEIAESRSERRVGAGEILESALNVARGIAFCDQGLGDRALPCFQLALEIQHSRSDDWRISGLHVNLAIAFSLAGDQRNALSSLTHAIEALDRAAIPDRWRRNRLAAIEINRGGALAMLGDLDGAIGAYLRARPHLEFGRDLITLGHLDFNLSKMYRDSGLFGSALESAESAHRAYHDAGAKMHARKARVAQAAALRRMDRLAEAEALIVTECIPKSLDGLSGTELAAAIDAIDELAYIYRATDRYAAAQTLERTSTSLSLRLPNPELKALSVVTQYIFDAIANASAQQAFRSPSELEWAALDAIRRSPKRADAPLIADLLERLMRAHTSNDYEERALTDGEIHALDALGWDIPMWQSQLDVAVGIRQRDDDRLLRGHLFDLARFHALVAEQESPLVRSTMLSSRGGLTLDVVVPLLLRTGDHAGLFEVIEWMRCDLGDSRIPSAPHDLVRFGQVLGISDDTAQTYALPPPVALSVRGRSILRQADPSVEVVGEADEIRRGLAGQRSAWWTHMFYKGSLVWALLTPDGVHGGARPLEEPARTALQAHFRALPLSLAEDSSILHDENATWLRSVVAIARAAAGPLVQSKETLDQCVSASPESVANRLREEFPSVQDTLDDIYPALGRWMVPEELVDYLIKYSADARLLISVQPETASVPSCLLRTTDAEPLVEQAVLLYAPPVRIAADILRRPHRTGDARSHLLIRNPRGDLPDSELAVEGSRVLSGWATAASANEVASRDVVLRALQEEDVGARPSALSYFGHIESGEFGNPASAALLVAPDSPGGAGSRLSARDLSVAQVSMPDRIYLGGCEGAGFATSLEWSGIGAAALALGSEVVLAHRWPIIDGRHAGIVDQACMAIVADGDDPAARLGSLQRQWFRQWRERRPDAVPPHYWSGLQVIGRSVPSGDDKPSG